MTVDVLVLNTAVVDFRRGDFDFADALVGRGGLAKCELKDAPKYSQEQLHGWIEGGYATAGGPGNTAPLMSRAGVATAVGVNLGRGDYGGLDAQGSFFREVMTANGIDMSGTYIHPVMPTGTTYIHSSAGGERGGIAYFPGANDDFDFEIHKKTVERLKPRIIYYMYSGLSARGDANRGRDLAEFVKWCRKGGVITIVDSHTLTGDPQGLIKSGKAVKEYKLLEPLLPQVDIFFTSLDEARMIENTLGGKDAGPPAGEVSPRRGAADKMPATREGEHETIVEFLELLSGTYWRKEKRTRMFGVTVSNGAYERHVEPEGRISRCVKVESRFMAGEVVDLVGAGDSFRAGLLVYVAKNLEQFRKGTMDFGEAEQMGNLFASLYIKAPLTDRYRSRSYEKMLAVVRGGREYRSFAELEEALS